MFFLFLLCNDKNEREELKMKQLKAKNIIGYTLIIVGVALLSWALIGQMSAQISQSGAYYSFKTINDISLFGCIGVVPTFVGTFLIKK